MSAQIISTSKLQHVRNIGKMRLNGFGADVYTTASGKSFIVVDKLGSQVPFANSEFDSLEDAENWIDNFEGNNAGVLDQVLEELLPK